MIKWIWRKTGIGLILCLFIILTVFPLHADAEECGSIWKLRYQNKKALAWFSIAHSSTLFVATGEEGMLSISENGINWLGQGKKLTYPHIGVTYGQGKFVAVGWVGADSKGIKYSNNLGC